MLHDPHISSELKELSALVATISKSNVYTVSAGYFETLPGNIAAQVSNQFFAAIPGQTVPEGYFDGLAGSIMDKIRQAEAEETEGSSLLAPVKNKQVYHVPPSYFESLPDTISGRIKQEVGQSEQSLLPDSLKKINPYRVPADYFNTLSAVIQSKIATPAPVYIMKKRSSFFNYAVAAVITGMLGLSVMSILDKRQAEKSMGEEIAVNLNFDEALSDVSEEDIVAYLKQSGEDVNAALVASATDSKNLPDEMDYITNDKTLDNLLNELNIKDQSANN